jgi:hypothetical protein
VVVLEALQRGDGGLAERAEVEALQVAELARLFLRPSCLRPFAPSVM